MTEFRLTQISDTHLAPPLTPAHRQFPPGREHIDATRPDLVVNSGDLAFDAPDSLTILPLQVAARRAARSLQLSARQS